MIKPFFSLIILFGFSQCSKYTPDWSSLDTRSLPKWYDDAKIGIFIHWGVFSVPGFRSEWFWWDWQGDKPTDDVVDFMKKNYPPNFQYADFAPEFKAEFFDPQQWASLFNASGAKYVVLTSKHHEGYTLWPSSNSWNWNAYDVGPHRDLVGDLANAIRKNTSLRFGLYHSLYEWFNPLYLSDKNQSFHKQDFVNSKILPSLHEIVLKYNPEVLWSDGDWDAPYSYWNSTDFIAWLYNESPVKNTIVVNDRWGYGVMCQHGDFYTCQDNYNPGKLIEHKWENCMPLDKNSWGFRRNMKLEEILTIEEVLTSLVETVSCGGNILINIGPTKEGSIPPIFEERLRQLGQWLSFNGEAIYETKPWKFQNDTKNSNVWYTTNGDIVYAILLKYPYDTLKVELGAPQSTEATRISILGTNQKVQWIDSPEGGIIIDLQNIDPNSPNLKWAWAFKMVDIS